MYIAAIRHKCVSAYTFFALSIFSFLSGKSQDFEQKVREIERYHKKIDKSLSSFSVQEMKGFEFSKQGNKATKYFDEEEMVKVDAIDFTKEFRQERAFYLKAGELLMISEIFFKYNAPIDQDQARAKLMGLNKWYDPEKTSKTTKIYYFQNEELLGMKARGEYVQRSDEDNLAEYETYFLKLTASYLSPAEKDRQ